MQVEVTVPQLSEFSVNVEVSPETPRLSVLGAKDQTKCRRHA